MCDQKNHPLPKTFYLESQFIQHVVNNAFIDQGLAIDGCLLLVCVCVVCVCVCVCVCVVSECVCDESGSNQTHTQTHSTDDSPLW